MGPYPKVLALTQIGRGNSGGRQDIGGSRQSTERQAGSAQSAHKARYEPAPPVDNKPASKQVASP